MLGGVIGEALFVIRHWIRLTLEPAKSTSEQAMLLHHSYFVIRQLNRLGFSYRVTPGKEPMIQFIRAGQPTMCAYRATAKRS
jgi:hypothetical protein